MLKALFLTVLSWLAAAPAMATFELLDPAADVQDEEAQKAADFAAVSCHDFLLNSAGDADEYQAQLKWVIDQVREGDPTSISRPVEPSLRSYCIENARHTLEAASQVLSTEEF